MRKSFLLGVLALTLVFGFMGCDESGINLGVQNKVTVSNVPAAITIAIVSESLDLESFQAPVAVAGKNGTSFAFYELGDSGPDLTKPWKDVGDYYLVLAEDFQGTNAYIYTGTGGKFSFNGGTKMTYWTQFSKMGGSDDDEAYVLTVTGIPSSANIVGAAVRSDLSITAEVIAVAMNVSGTFKFYEPNFAIPSMPMPSSVPWSEDGEFALVISTMAGQQYLYTSSANNLFDFTGDTGNTDWADFTQL